MHHVCGRTPVFYRTKPDRRLSLLCQNFAIRVPGMTDDDGRIAKFALANSTGDNTLANFRSAYLHFRQV